MLHGENNSARGFALGKTLCGCRVAFRELSPQHHHMESDHSTGALKSFVKAVGLLSVLIFDSRGTRPLGYLFFGIIGFFAWRMFRDWNKSTVQVYSLVQSILTGVAVAQIAKLFWPQFATTIGAFVVLIFGSRLEVFLLRYTGFSKRLPKAEPRKNAGGETDGTPWQNNPAHTAS
jgi:hypothetical protein